MIVEFIKEYWAFCWSLSNYIDGAILAGVLAVIVFVHTTRGGSDDDKTAAFLLLALATAIWPITAIVMTFILLCVFGLKVVNLGRSTNAS
jgi:hypothetical protein